MIVLWYDDISSLSLKSSAVCHPDEMTEQFPACCYHQRWNWQDYREEESLLHWPTVNIKANLRCVELLSHLKNSRSTWHDNFEIISMWEVAAGSCLILTEKKKKLSSGSYLDAINDRESGNSSIITMTNIALFFLFRASFVYPAHIMMVSGLWMEVLKCSNPTYDKQFFEMLFTWPAIPHFSVTEHWAN